MEVVITADETIDYQAEVQELMTKWGEKYVKWLKLDTPGKYPLIAMDEPDIVDIKGKAVMKVPVAYEQQMRYVGFGESDNPMSCYVGLLAVGYYEGSISGWEFQVVVEEDNEILYKYIPDAEPYVNQLIADSQRLSTETINQLLEQQDA